MKFTVKLTRESYVDIKAENYEQASDIVYKQGLSDEQIENGAEHWDIDSISKSEEE